MDCNRPALKPGVGGERETVHKVPRAPGRDAPGLFDFREFCYSIPPIRYLSYDTIHMQTSFFKEFDMRVDTGAPFLGEDS
jgi:hypothetical protein